MFDNMCVCREHEGDMPEFCHDKMVTAYKEHRCCECNEVIKKGDRYELTRGKWDGRFGTYKTCRVCAAIRKDFMSCGWTYGQLWEDLRESLAEKNEDTGRWETPAWLD
jgi:hypothetical protein